MKTFKILTAMLTILAAASFTSCNTPRGATSLSDDGRHPEYFGGQGNQNKPTDYVPRHL